MANDAADRRTPDGTNRAASGEDGTGNAAQPSTSHGFLILLRQPATAAQANDQAQNNGTDHQSLLSVHCIFPCIVYDAECVVSTITMTLTVSNGLKAGHISLLPPHNTRRQRLVIRHDPAR